MRRTYRYIYLLLKLNIGIVIQYRGTFFAGVLSSILWLVLSIISIGVLTYQTPEVGGWNRYELLAVQGVYSVVLGFMYMIFGENIKNLTQLVRLGNLDFIFIKPMDGQLLVSIKQIRFHHLARIVSGLALIIYSITRLNISIEFVTLFSFLVFIISSILVVYSLWFGLMILSFWFVDLYNLWEFLQHFTGITRYPLEVIRHVREYLLYVLMPLVVVTSVPAQILIGKFNLELGIWSVVTAVTLFTLTRKFWLFALKYYTSASS